MAATSKKEQYSDKEVEIPEPRETVAEFLARGGEVEICPERLAQAKDGVSTMRVKSAAPSGKARARKQEAKFEIRR